MCQSEWERPCQSLMGGGSRLTDVRAEADKLKDTVRQVKDKLRMYAETNYDAASLFDTPSYDANAGEGAVEEYLARLEGPGGNKQRCGMLCDGVADKLEAVLEGRWEGGEEWEKWVKLIVNADGSDGPACKKRRKEDRKEEEEEQQGQEQEQEQQQQQQQEQQQEQQQQQQQPQQQQQQPQPSQPTPSPEKDGED